MENAMQPLLPPPPPPAFNMPRSSTEQTVTHELIFGTSIAFRHLANVVDVKVRGLSLASIASARSASRKLTEIAVGSSHYISHDRKYRYGALSFRCRIAFDPVSQ
ncbi:hypothetical protein ALC56_14854 [Trachymyrmex septentrionalis]|uniref:Uncharacterized protein n=1 Tax=Trachymyrmex septentrionalis TaxID=34720 RepID=A0A195ET02_9HYME|nr:hypothetical protein ALC56_14854 [Trachymyrmex septentrionalis]